MPRYYDTDGNYTVFGILGRELYGLELATLAGVTGNIQEQLNSAGGSAQPICQAMPDGSGTGTIEYVQADYGELQPIPLAVTANTALGQMYTDDMIDGVDNTILKAPSAGWYRLTFDISVTSYISDPVESVGDCYIMVHRSADTATSSNYIKMSKLGLDKSGTTQINTGTINGTVLLPLDADEGIRLHFLFEGVAGEFASATIYTNDYTGAPEIQSLVIFEKVRDI